MRKQFTEIWIVMLTVIILISVSGFYLMNIINAEEDMSFSPEKAGFIAWGTTTSPNVLNITSVPKNFQRYEVKSDFIDGIVQLSEHYYQRFSNYGYAKYYDPPHVHVRLWWDGSILLWLDKDVMPHKLFLHEEKVVYREREPDMFTYVMLSSNAMLATIKILELPSSYNLNYAYLPNQNATQIVVLHLGGFRSTRGMINSLKEETMRFRIPEGLNIEQSYILAIVKSQTLHSGSNMRLDDEYILRALSFKEVSQRWYLPNRGSEYHEVEILWLDGAGYFGLTLVMLTSGEPPSYDPMAVEGESMSAVTKLSNVGDIPKEILSSSGLEVSDSTLIIKKTSEEIRSDEVDLIERPDIMTLGVIASVIVIASLAVTMRKGRRLL